MKKKILIIYASFGNGHKSIAKYIENYLREKDLYEIEMIDIVEYSSFLGKIANKLFNYNLKRRKEYLFTLIFELSNKKLTTISYKKTAQRLYNRKLMKKIVEFDPDLTISTHFFSSILMGCYKEKGITNSKIISVITDYYAYELVTKNQKYDDAIVVGDEIVKNILIDKGVQKNKIKIFGLPVANKFQYDLLDKKEVLEKYTLNEKYPIFLMFGGSSYASKTYFKFFKKIADLKSEFQLIFISGANEEFKNKCYKYVKHNKIKNVKVLGYIEDIQNLMNISNLIITKAGGATITECISLKKPMILIPGYGGVEFKNASYLLKKGYAKRVFTSFGLKRTINKIIDSPKIVESLQNNLNKANKNDSLENLYKLINKLIK